MVDITRATPEDFSELMHQVVRSYRVGNPGHPRFEELYPDSVRDDAVSMHQWRIVRREGRIVAGMQVVPRSLVAAGVVHVSAGGLGNVFCLPELRGCGLMSALLRTVVAEMPAEGHALALLGGDRTRYGHFGWETAGSLRRLSLSLRMARHSNTSVDTKVDVRTWAGGSAPIESLWETYQALPYRTERTLGEFAMVLRRPGQVVWIATSAEGLAYLSVRGRTIVEYAGHRRPLEVGLRTLLRAGNMTVDIPPVAAETASERMFTDYASGYSVCPLGMIRINSLALVLGAYAPVLNRALAGWEGRALFTVEEDLESLQLIGDGTGIALCPGANSTVCDLVVSASRRDWARLLFGPFAPALDAGMDDAFLRRAFPLPLFWHPLSHV